MQIRERIVSEFSNLKIKINYPEKNVLNLVNNKLKVEAVFISEKPLSFTVKLEFFDD